MFFKGKKVYFNGTLFWSNMKASTLTTVITYFMVLLDTIIAGHMIGEKAIAAVALVIPLFTVYVFVGTIISVGASANHAYHTGRFDKHRADEFFGQGCVLSAFAGMVLCVLLLLGEDVYFAYVAPDEDILVLAKQYYSMYPFIALFFPMFMTMAEMSSEDGDDDLSNSAYTIYITVNTICSVALCSSMGMKGISCGTLIGTIVGLLMLLTHFTKENNTLAFIWHFTRADMYRIGRRGVTDGEKYLLAGLLYYCLNIFIIERFNSDLLAVFSIAASAVELGAFSNGISASIQSIVSICRGEGNLPGIKKIMSLAEKTAVLEGLVMMALLFVLAKPFVMMMGIDDPLLVDQTVIAVRIISTTFVFAALNDLFISYYLYIEKIAFSIVMALVSGFLAPLLISTLTAIFIGEIGIWIGLAAAPFVALAMTAFFISKIYGKEAFPLLLPRDASIIFNYDITLNLHQLGMLLDSSYQFLKDNHVDHAIANKTQLVLEEYSVGVMEQNPTQKDILLSATIKLQDTIEVIIRDTGKIQNVTSDDYRIGSISNYMLNLLVTEEMDGINLTTLGYNRNSFRIEE